MDISIQFYWSMTHNFNLISYLVCQNFIINSILLSELKFFIQFLIFMLLFDVYDHLFNINEKEILTFLFF